MVELVCPIDHGKISETMENFSCKLCNTTFPMVDIGDQKIPDFRCLEKSKDIELTFTIPQNPLKIENIDSSV